MIPFGDKITDYFHKYQSAQSHLNGILHALRSGQDELQRDNVALNLEKQQLWDSMGRLNQYVYIAERLDAKLAAQVATMDLTEPEKAKAMREDVLFYIRQKHQDLLTQLAVSIQNYLAIDIVIKNNYELIKGVDRATTTTISACAPRHRRPGADEPTPRPRPDHRAQRDDERADQRTSGCSGQLDQDSGAGRERDDRVAATSARLQNIYATMDAIDTFKVQALDNMAATIGTLETEVAKSRSYLDRVQRTDHRLVSGSLNIDQPQR